MGHSDTIRRICFVSMVMAMVLCGVSCDCPLPELPFLDGNMTSEDGVDIDNSTVVEELTVLSFTCADGFSLVGAAQIQCYDDEWSSKIPFCADTDCLDPPIVENATVVIRDQESGIGSLAQYSCDGDYELVNPNASALECTVNVENRTSAWEGEIPACRAKLPCLDPGISPNGNRTGDCCSSGDQMQFSCHDGYELVGEEEITCVRDGLWSARRPLCRPLDTVYCEFLGSISHGIVKGRKAGDYFLPGEKAEVICQPGYRCEKDDVIVCEEGGTWNKELGVCKEVFCDAPPDVKHGRIVELQSTNSTQFKYGFEIHYVCDKGYRIINGDSWRMCINKGVWSGKNPVCGVIRCPDPGTPENGQRSGSDASVGSRVLFNCDSGYDLLGAKEILCQANGQWAGELTRCNLPSNYCPDPGTPMQGSKNASTYKMGDRVRFRCDPRTFMLGSEIRECLPDRTWSGKPTRCVGLYDFDNPASVKDQLVSRMSEIRDHQKKEWLLFEEAGRGKSIMGHPGVAVLYFAFDVSGSVSPSHFEKSVQFAKAIVKEVGVSAKTRVGAITFASKANGIFLPLHYETTEDVLQALDNIEHTGGGTSASSALSFIRKEYIPLVHGRMENVDIKSVLFILTDGRATVGGNPKSEAELLKSAGVSIYCIGITGNIMKKALYDIASRSEENDTPLVFMLQDYEVLSWLVTEIAHGTANYSQCGVGKENVGVSQARIVGGWRVKDPWPWMAALNMTTFQDKPEKRVMCGGSIIHEYFILTAAHCLYYGNVLQVMRKEKDITVKVGVVRLNDTAHLQELSVRKIHVHRSFNRTSLDRDIALLELRNPVHFTKFVRPICLPPKDIEEGSSFYKPSSIVWISGFGHVSMMKKHEPAHKATISQDLKEIALPVQAWDTCKDSLKDDEKEYHYFSEHMFCAGTGGRRNDSCLGDSGGPVMHQRLNDLGYVSWTQVGIVSWGVGCGLKDEYGIYVHLQKLMPWVESTIQEAEKHGRLRSSENHL